MAENSTDEKKVPLYGTGCLLTINPNKEYDDKGTWKFVQKIFMRIVLSDDLLYCFDMRYHPEDEFFTPTKKELRGISDEFVVRGSPEVGEILERFHLHVMINPYMHEYQVKFNLDLLRARLAEREIELNEELKKEDKNWENITINWYCFVKKRAIISTGDARYLTKDKPASKEIDIDTVYILPGKTESKKFKRSGLIDKENGTWQE